MSDMQTEQESFWSGEFGDEYSRRNRGTDWIAANCALFSRVLAKFDPPSSVMEFGANVGLNLRALHLLLPGAELHGLELNPSAAAELADLEFVNANHGSIFDYQPERQFDLVLSKGLLIHLEPTRLPDAYDALYSSSRRFICICEYYSPRPVALEYRGDQNKLFKRDFAGEMLDRFSDLTLRDYGFVYHRGSFPQDDINWFLLERSK